MKNQLILFLNTIFMAIILQSCSDSSNEIPLTEEPKETTTVTELSEANQFLGWNLLNQEFNSSSLFLVPSFLFLILSHKWISQTDVECHRTPANLRIYRIC